MTGVKESTVFVQVIQGRTGEREALRGRFDVWREELQADAVGWLGSTSGVTDDGEFIAVVRFESEEAARRNSYRPEQGRWWADTAVLFEGEATFHDATDVQSWRGGASTDAGFVQIIQGRVNDLDRAKELEREFEQRASDMRPEILGGVIAWHGTERFTEAVYFTNESDAREGEAKAPPEDLRPLLDEYERVYQDLRYFDLREPWHDEA